MAAFGRQRTSGGARVRYRKYKRHPAAAAQQRRRRRATRRPADGLSSGAAAHAYLQACSHLKPSTQTTYRDIVGPFVAFVGPALPVAALTPEHIEDWLSTTKTNAVSRRKYVKHLGYFFRYLVRQGQMERDISEDVGLAQVPHKYPKFMTPEQVGQLTCTIEEHMRRHADNPRVPDYTWLVRLIRCNAYLGLRRGEVIHLRWEHVDLGRRMLLIANTDEFTTKSGKERMLPMCDVVYSVLAEMREERSEGYVFESHKGKLQPSGLSHAFLRFRRMAGLPNHVSFHSLRHTALSWLAMRGASVEAIRLYAGHSTIAVTQRYMHLAPAAYHDEIVRAFTRM